MTKFKVMTWNLENLYRNGSGYGPDTKAEYDNKLNNLADIIHNLDPDVLAVQEVGSQDSFDDLILLLGNYTH